MIRFMAAPVSTLSAVLGSVDRNGAAGSAWGCATVYGDGVHLGSINVSAFDENGSGGVNPVDMSEWLTDAFASPEANVSHSDFDCSHSVGPPDLSLLIEASLGGGSSTSCTTYCR